MDSADVAWFDDVDVGYAVIGEHHDVTEQEIIEFAQVWDPMPFHIDKAAALDSPYRGLIASGAHSYAIYLKLCHKQRPKLAVIAALTTRDMSFPNPIRPGDRLILRGVCLSRRESQSKPDRGIVEIRSEVSNQAGQVVLVLTQAIMLAKRGSGHSAVFSVS